MKNVFSFFLTLALSVGTLWADTPQVVTVAEALAIGDTLAANTTSEQIYSVDGYVVAAEAYSSQYTNQNFWLVDQLGGAGLPLYVYRGKTQTPVQYGYRVRFDFKIQNYGSNHIIEALNAYVVIAETTVPATDHIFSGNCGAQGNNLTWQLNARTGQLTVAGSGEMVDSVGYVPWQRQNMKYMVRKATLPLGMTNIGISAFDNCTNLDSVVIPDGVTKIGKWAFYNCKSLTTLNMPESVDSIGIPAFNGCSLTDPLYNSRLFCFLPTGYSGSYTIPDGIRSVISYAFDGRSGVTEIVLPASVRHISYRTFRNCTGLQSMTCHATTPPACHYEEYFDGVDKTIPLYVPAESILLYRQATGWSEFTNILPIPGSGVEQITDDQSPKTNKLLRDGRLTIERGGRTYSVSGQELK